MDKIYKFLATAAYTGLLPRMPGTWGSIFGALFVYFVFSKFSLSLKIILILLFTLLGIISSYKVSKNLNNKDPDIVVIDEFVGILLTFLFVPVNLESLVLGTILFRIIDILKPFPLKKLEKYPYGIGIMLDDIAAGLISGLILYGLFKFFNF
ncbi:MAG TPA: phosphatidylglycerophosphatase A [Aquificae bacterium]|nr:phosphatidylglycerophosphatase A [Aquificota bacterium]